MVNMDADEAYRRIKFQAHPTSELGRVGGPLVDRIDALQGEVRQLREQYETLKSEDHELHGAYLRLRAENERLQAEVERLESSVEAAYDLAGELPEEQ